MAALKSNYTCFNRLLVNLEKCDIKDEFGRTAMMFALVNCKDKNDCVNSLLKREDCDLNAVDNEHRNVLFYSVNNSNLEMVNLFLNSGVNALQKCLTGKTVLHLAAFQGNTEVFHFLIENLKQCNVSYEQLLDNDGYNPLHYACFKGNGEIVKMLINSFPEKNQFVNSMKKINYLHLTSYSSDEECLKLILNQFGQSIVNQTDSKGRNALHYLCMSKIQSSSNNTTANQLNQQQLKQLNQHSFASASNRLTEQSLSELEINQKQLTAYKLLIKNQININCKDKYGKTPLMIAIQNECCRLSLCLIDEPSIDLLIKDQNDCTALHYACKFKNELAGQKLIKKDLSLVNLANKNARTALHIAAPNGLFDLTKSLLSSGASCFIQDTDGSTPGLACVRDY